MKAATGIYFIINFKTDLIWGIFFQLNENLLKMPEKLTNKDVLVLFDVDGTLTPASQSIRPEIEDCLLNEIK